MTSIVTPNDILDRRRREFCQSLLLLNIEKDDRSRRGKDKRSRSSVEDLVGLSWAFDRFGKVVGQISNFDVLL